MALNACLQVTPLWSLCGVTCTQVPRTQHLSFAVCVHTQFRCGSTPPREGCQVLLLSLCLSVSLVCCPVCVLGHCQVPGHGRHTTKMAIMRSAHLPPQGEGGRVGCAGACGRTEWNTPPPPEPQPHPPTPPALLHPPPHGPAGGPCYNFIY